MSTHSTNPNRLLAEQSPDLEIPEDEFNSGNGKLVYLYVKMKEETTLENMCDDLDLGHFTAGGILKILLEKEYVERDGDKVIFCN